MKKYGGPHINTSTAPRLRLSSSVRQTSLGEHCSLAWGAGCSEPFSQSLQQSSPASKQIPDLDNPSNSFVESGCCLLPHFSNCFKALFPGVRCEAAYEEANSGQLRPTQAVAGRPGIAHGSGRRGQRLVSSLQDLFICHLPFQPRK